MKRGEGLRSQTDLSSDSALPSLVLLKHSRNKWLGKREAEWAGTACSVAGWLLSAAAAVVSRGNL